jgi:hypothetical protein
MPGKIQRNENRFEASAPPESCMAPVKTWIKPEIEILPADEAEAQPTVGAFDGILYS